MKSSRNFLNKAERAELVKIARDGLEEHRIARRANAILLLDRGMSFEEVASVLFVDDSTVRIWLKAFSEAGVEAIVMFDLKGGFSPLSPLQLDELRAWATEVLPTSTTEVGQFVKERFGLDYTRSGLIKLMNRIGFDWQKPEAVPGRIDVDAQKKFINAHEDLRNSLTPDEAIVYVDAVHPTHQTRFAGRWLPRDQRCAIATASGRDRLNLHGAIDLETGLIRIIEVQTVDAMSTIALFEAMERAYPALILSLPKDAPHPHLPRQRPLPPRQARPGMARATGAAHRPALRSGVLPASKPDRAALVGDAQAHHSQQDLRQIPRLRRRHPRLPARRRAAKVRRIFVHHNRQLPRHRPEGFSDRRVTPL